MSRDPAVDSAAVDSAAADPATVEPSGDAPQRTPDAAGARLISHCGHALRTPLNAILGFAQILALDPDEPLTPTQRERIDQIQEAGWQLLRMIDAAVDLAHIGAGQLSISMRPVALGPLLLDSLARMGPQAAADRVHLEAGPAHNANAWADPERLSQIIVNLLRGVLQGRRRGEPVRVGVRTHADGGATIWIRDTATSMALEQVEKTFLPFDHVALDGAPGQNVQVSLALAQKLIELMGGRLQVHRHSESEIELRLRLRGAAVDGAAPRRADAR